MNGDLILEDFSSVDLSDIKLPIVVVYFDPKDYPDKYVARIWDASIINARTNIVLVEDDLDTIRREILASRPYNVTRFDRAESDDPKIVECYLL